MRLLRQSAGNEVGGSAVELHLLRCQIMRRVISREGERRKEVTSSVGEGTVTIRPLMFVNSQIMEEDYVTCAPQERQSSC